jgi:hypothetical protein
MKRFSIALQALRELGPSQIGWLALYKLGLKSGHYRRAETPISLAAFPLQSPFGLPDRQKLLETLGQNGLQALLQAADSIVQGQYSQFGAELVKINLTPAHPDLHWTELETRPHPTDIKLIWEPARFGWAFTLGRAWLASGDERYPAAFWRYFETFQAANLPYLGENWTSAQEVGLRLMAWAWAGQIFSQSEQTSLARRAVLAVSIGQHAARIVPTLLYAQAQNNNHLLTESAALYTASLVLPAHPAAQKWQKIGATWLKWCFSHQIDSSGEYIQHSSNYHRLMLQIALWLQALPGSDQIFFDSRVKENLALATHWLYCLLDFESGQVPNLGPNDGAYLFPFTNQPFQDYRPVVQAAACAFLAYSLPPGAWDEMSLWFQVEAKKLKVEAALPADLRLLGLYPSTLQVGSIAWAYLRTAQLRSRPGHADLLHFDFWWRGQNITLDPGTYQYNAPAPWENTLTAACYHNTVTVDGLDQFTRVSRFLYLKRADALRLKLPSPESLAARHYAYAGVRHTRQITALNANHWRIVDELLNLRRQPHTFRLHWLLPDVEHKLIEEKGLFKLRLKLAPAWLTIVIHCDPANVAWHASLVRAGSAVDPARGWFSPTYSVKQPALSLAIDVQSRENLEFVTDFEFSDAI